MLQFFNEIGDKQVQTKRRFIWIAFIENL